MKQLFSDIKQQPVQDCDSSLRRRDTNEVISMIMLPSCLKAFSRLEFEETKVPSIDRPEYQSGGSYAEKFCTGVP